MSRKRLVILGGLVVVLAVVAFGLYQFFDDDAPPEVSLDAAVAQVTDAADDSSDDDAGDDTANAGDTTTTATEIVAADETTTTAAAPTSGDVSGAWTVDTESGEFDYESATGSFVGFRIDEELSGIGSTTAVGRTGTLTGSIEIDGTTLTTATFEVDLTTITTNESRRDSRVQQALETDQFPTATFTLTEPVDLGAGAADGEAISVTANGELTIHGVTRPVAFPLEAQLVADTVVVVGSLDIVFADYGVTVPSAPVVLSVEDNGILELQLLFTR